MLNYAVVSADAAMALRGKRSAFVVLVTLLLHRNIRTKRTQFMSIARIAGLSGLSRSTTYLALVDLMDMDFIEHVAERRGEHMYYLTLLDAQVDATVDEIEEVYDTVEEQFEAIFTRREVSGGK